MGGFHLLACLCFNLTSKALSLISSSNNYTLALMDYPLWWVVCSYDLYMYTGDKDYVSGYYANLVAVLDRFYPSVTNNNTNLIQKGVGISGSYGDYAFLPRDGPVTYYNALYVLALKNAATIANSLNHVADAQRWTDRATLVSAAINNRRFDSSVGAYFDGNCGFEPCATHAQDGNSIVVVSGAANLTYAQSAPTETHSTTTTSFKPAFPIASTRSSPTLRSKPATSSTPLPLHSKKSVACMDG
jgi:hypothetical protein